MEIWYDNDVEDINREEDNSIKEYDITSTPNDYNIVTLFNLIDNGIIKMPPFQRNYVWDKKRASKFIESLILGLPIPQVFLYERGKDNFFVIDGQQRIMSIYFFMKEKFPTKEGKNVLRDYMTGSEMLDQSILSDDRYFENFSLVLPSPIAEEPNKLNKLKYETLGEYKRTFEFLRTIRTIVIKQNAPDDEDSSMYEIFNRLNTGGQNLTPQEIRMSLFYSAFYDMIMRINKDQRWRNLMGQKDVDLHFKDIEVLIRGFAMLFGHEQYVASMSRFLNKFSKESDCFDEEKIDYCKKLFESFLQSCSQLSTQSFLNANKKFNISLYEAVFVAICEDAVKKGKFVEGKIVEKTIEDLKDDTEFSNASKESITSKKNVKMRIKRAKELIKIR